MHIAELLHQEEVYVCSSALSFEEEGKRCRFREKRGNMGLMKQRARARKKRALGWFCVFLRRTPRRAWTGRGKELQGLAKFSAGVVGGSHPKVLRIGTGTLHKYLLSL